MSGELMQAIQTQVHKQTGAKGSSDAIGSWFLKCIPILSLYHTFRMISFSLKTLIVDINNYEPIQNFHYFNSLTCSLKLRFAAHISSQVCYNFRMSLKRQGTLGAGKLVISPCKLQILISLEDGTAIEPDRYRLGFSGWRKPERSKKERMEEK